MSRFRIGSMALLASLAVAAFSRPDADGVPQERGAIMKEKLELAQKLLAGLSKDELDGVATDAAALAALTRDARWRIQETPEYLSRSVEFERTAMTLGASAGNKNADGAAFAWVQMSTQCLDCHRWFRNSNRSR